MLPHRGSRCAALDNQRAQHGSTCVQNYWIITGMGALAQPCGLHDQLPRPVQCTGSATTEKLMPAIDTTSLFLLNLYAIEHGYWGGTKLQHAPHMCGPALRQRSHNSHAYMRCRHCQTKTIITNLQQVQHWLRAFVTTAREAPATFPYAMCGMHCVSRLPISPCFNHKHFAKHCIQNCQSKQSLFSPGPNPLHT